jgi:excisionase family DNA binding protein
MAVDNYRNLPPQERLSKITQVINKGIYLYYEKTNGKMEESSQEKGTASILKIKHKESVNVEDKICLNDKILTIKETTEFLKISRTTLWRLRKHKKMPFCLIGQRRLIRFKLSEILIYLNSKMATENT